jgi:hypothetical protein
MKKITKLSMLTMGLLVCCTKTVVTTNPSPGTSNTPLVVPSPSSTEPSASPIVFIPKKGSGAITGKIELDKNLKIGDQFNIEIKDIISNKVLKSKKVNKNQEFIIDDIPTLDKNGTDIRLQSTLFKQYVDTKIFDSKLTNIGTITISGSDIFYVDFITSAIFIVQDKNNVPYKGGEVKDITGGYISFEQNINERGRISVSLAPDTPSFKSPRKIEIKIAGKFMTFLLDKHDYSSTKNITFVPNARMIYGYIFDSNNKSKTLPGLKVKVLDQDIAVRTDEYGRYELRGVPFDEVNLEIDDTLKVNVPKVSDSEERLMADIFYSGS